MQGLSRLGGREGVSDGVMVTFQDVRTLGQSRCLFDRSLVMMFLAGLGLLHCYCHWLEHLGS